MKLFVINQFILLVVTLTVNENFQQNNRYNFAQYDIQASLTELLGLSSVPGRLFRVSLLTTRFIASRAELLVI